eukprot:jgi/Picsp_1/3849/NSC_01361-R1_hypothetical zinc-dependent dna-binding protein
MTVHAQKTETAPQMETAAYGDDGRVESTEILEIMDEDGSIGVESGSVQSIAMVFGCGSNSTPCDACCCGETKEARLVPVADTDENHKQAEIDNAVVDHLPGAECEEKGESSEGEESSDWISRLISLDFFQPCRVHRGCRKNECNFFCLERDGGGQQQQGNDIQALCKYCLDDPGFSGICFQIRRYMYQNVVHVEDLGMFYDASGIQAYFINGKRAVLLSPKSPPANTSAAPAFDHVCRSCRVPLRPDCSFCSLHCKVWSQTGKEPRTPFPAAKRKRVLTFSVDESDATVVRGNNLEPRDRSKSRPERSLRSEYSQARLSKNVRITNRRKRRRPMRSPEF